MFETNPSVRKRQQNRLLRKLRGIIYEFTGRVGKQAVVLVATPGKPNTSYKVFGAKPLEDVLRNLKNIVMDELDNALAQQAPPPQQEDPTLFELPGLVIDGIPTPVEKMTQAQLRAFIPLMLKYSTGRGKPGWGRESTRPPWWPKELPWANVRMDARSEDDKQKISWTHALRKIVINCYKYHGRDDLLPTFADEDEKVTALVAQINYGVGAAVSSLNQNNHRDADADDDDDDDDDADADENDLDDLEEQQQQQQQQQQIVSTRLATSGSSHTQQQQQHHQQQQQQVNVVKINSAGTVITTHHAQTNAPAPTIIQSTNNQHITTTATLPASTKIEICQAPAPGTQQQQQQQHQHHHQQQQQSAGATTIHIQPTGISQGQPQTIQLTTASGTATATATAITAGSVSAGTQTTATAATLNNQQQLLNNHHHHHHQQQQQQQQQFTHNTHVCLEPLTLRHPCHDVDAVDDIVDQVDDDVDDVDYTTTQTVLSQNPDGSVSIIQVDPNNPIITLPDGTTAQVQGVATLHQGEGGTTTIQTVQSLSDVNGHENMTVDLTEAQDGQIYFTTEDGQDYPVSVSNVISVPVSMYQTVMANMQQLQTNSDGTVCLAPMQVQVASGNNINNNSHTTTAAAAALTSSGSNSSTGAITAPPALQCYQLITATSGAINRRPHQQQAAITLQATTPAPTTTAASTVAATPRFYCLNYGQGQGTSTFNLNNNNNNTNNNNNATSATIKMPMPMPIVLANSTGTTANLRRRTTGTKRRRQKTTTPTALGRGTSAAVGAAAAVEAGTSAGASSSGGSSSSTAIRCVDSANLQTAKTIKLEHLE